MAEAPFGVTLRERRVKAGLTQHELARLAGVSVRAVGYIEQGQPTRPRETTVVRLAEAMGLDPAKALSQRAQSHLSVHVLGPLTVLRYGQPVDVGPMRQRGILGLLALHPNELVSANEIIGMLWGEHPPAGHRNVVHTYLARLRRSLGADREVQIVSEGGGYRLKCDVDSLDLLRFTASLTKDTSLEGLGRALDCWDGEIMATLRTHPAAVAVSERRLSVALRYAETAIGLGLHREAVNQLQRLVPTEPLHERLHAQLMLALAGTGQRAAALRLFHDLRDRLDDELGIAPGEQARAAYLRVLRQDAHFWVSAPRSAISPVLADLATRDVSYAS